MMTQEVNKTKKRSTQKENIVNKEENKVVDKPVEL